MMTRFFALVFDMGGLHKVNHPFLKFHLLVGHVHYTKGKGGLSIRKDGGTGFLGQEMKGDVTPGPCL
jgi:hypothetical protein